MKTLKLSDISKKYNDITVLANANAEFTSSKITCIRGQSGAGKTTLLNIIMGVVKADKGKALSQCFQQYFRIAGL